MSVVQAQAEIRRCVHCGFCTATCPTYVLLGDERDSPRGRIELIREMLKSDGPPAPSTVTHIDRCLSCLSCVTTCPSGVNYATLIDEARAHIEINYDRPWPEQMLRDAIARVLTDRRLLGWALLAGRLARPLEKLLPAPLATMLRLTPRRPAKPARPGVYPPPGEPRGRVALLQGCVEPAMAPQVGAAAIRLLNRMGFEVVLAEGEGCCGAIHLHMGRDKDARAFARANLAAWAAAGDVSAVISTAAGCGTMLKTYGADFAAYDILEFVAREGLPPVEAPSGLAVAYHAACSLQHGQHIKAEPPRLLAEAGFEVRTIAEGHLCCGSAGTYAILQPELSGRLRERKAANIEKTGAAVVAAGNVGCMAQLSPALSMPVVHPVELLDWATGGPRPAALA